ncbi:MAG: apolipoprotein N-acyltransferase, partial [Bryobacteraceae bacterium]
MRSLLFAAASAGLLVLVYPGFDFAWLAPVCLAPLLAAMAGEPSTGRRLLIGWIAGIVYWGGACYWIRDVLVMYGGLAGPGAWGAFGIFCGAKAVHLAVFCAMAGPLMNRWYAIPAAAALWTGLERTHGPLGFAWLTLGNAGIDMAVPLRMAPFTGVYGVSFVLLMMNAAVALLWLRRPRRELLWLAALPLLFLVPRLPSRQQGTRSVALVQPNVPMHAEWTEQSMRGLHDRMSRLSLETALAPGEPPPDLLAWPESPAPIYFETDATFRARAQELARLVKAPFLFGTVGYTKEQAPLNSAMMLDAAGEPAGRYDKINLVPFGEFIPPFFSFVQRITQESGDFAPGREIVIMPAGRDRVGPFICYESAFPHFVREFAARGATVFVNMSNDGYFGRTAAREQHLLVARMRAVENRRWLVRPTNDGYTSVIDPAGRITDLWPPHEQRSGRMRYGVIEEKTLYTRAGDWFAWLCLAAGVS